MDITTISPSLTGTKPATTTSDLGNLARTTAANDSQVTNTIRALDAFRQELRSSLSAKFVTRFAPSEPSYSAVNGAPGVQDVANEALGVAQKLVDRAPAQAAQSIIKFRVSVSESAQSIRESLFGRGDIGSVAQTEALIGRGLDAIGERAAQTSESGASVLNIRSKITQNSTIKIRTQEGDFITLKLQNIDALNARDEATFNADGTATETNVNLRNATRVALSVEGDINAEEQAAIDSVISQASTIANEFFDGDIAAAFANAEDFEFDTQQLQRVKLNFRVREKTDISYAEQRTGIPADATLPAPDTSVAPTPVVTQPVVAPKEASAPILPITTPATIKTDIDALQPIIRTPIDVPATTDEVADTSAPEPAVDTATPTTGNNTALNKFFELISDFLTSTSESFNAGADKSVYYSDTFKLSLLRETLLVSAPSDQASAATAATDVIDQLESVGDEQTQS